MWKWIAVAAVSLVIVVEGCATRITGGVYDDDGGIVMGDDDMTAAPKPDLTELPPPPDLRAPPRDMTGKTCGDIMKCMFGCGLMIGGCQAMCFQGGSAEGLQQAGTLLACVVPNCLLNQADGGTGNIVLCVFNKCGMQVNNCKGFGF